MGQWYRSSACMPSLFHLICKNTILLFHPWRGWTVLDVSIVGLLSSVWNAFRKDFSAICERESPKDRGEAPVCASGSNLVSVPTM